MSVNIVQNGELLPIAGKTVPAPTPDYVDAQYSSSTTYSKGMTCIEGNVRYRYKNSTATSGHRPPDTTYWEVLSVADEIKYSSHTNLGTMTADTANNKWYLNNIESTLKNYKAFAIKYEDYAFALSSCDLDLMFYVKEKINSNSNTGFVSNLNYVFQNGTLIVYRSGITNNATLYGIK